MNVDGFLALAGRSCRLQETRMRLRRVASMAGLSSRVDCDELLAWSSGDAMVAEDGRALLYGVCFARTSGAERIETWPEGSKARPDRLIDSIWGSYVFLGSDANGQVVSAFREPSGGVPCYYLHVKEGLLLSNDAALLLQAAGRRSAVDWQVVLQGLAYPDLRGPATALRDVCELLPGERLIVSPDEPLNADVASVWAVDRVARYPGATSFEECSDRVRDEVRRCVGAWARLFRHPLLELSGGLDSSVTGACLQNLGASASGVTTWSPGLDADERHWARRAAEGLGLPLAEREADPLCIELGRSAAKGLPRPAARLFLQEVDRLHASVAREWKADALFSGGGGDNVFCHLQSAVPFADALLATRSPTAALNTASDISRSSGANVFEVVRRGWRRVRRRRSPRRVAANLSMFSHAVTVPASPIHPWIEHAVDLLPGKQDHLRLLVAVQNHREGLGRNLTAPVIFPLLSQPLMELCLSIPTPLWVRGGRDRAVVRHAFREELPSRIATRRTKGGFDSFADAIYRVHFDEIRSRLADGCLARERLLDREAALRDHREGEAADRLRVLTLLDVESWAASWT